MWRGAEGGPLTQQGSWLSQGQRRRSFHCPRPPKKMLPRPCCLELGRRAVHPRPNLPCTAPSKNAARSYLLASQRARYLVSHLALESRTPGSRALAGDRPRRLRSESAQSLSSPLRAGFHQISLQNLSRALSSHSKQTSNHTFSSSHENSSSSNKRMED